MFNRILVPLDGSTLAERALPHAEEFARIFGSTIILLQVLDPTSFHENPNPVDPLSWQIRKTEADIYMNNIASRLRKDLRESVINIIGSQKRQKDDEKILVEYSIREGKTAESIVNFAHSENIDMVILCTHGSGGLSRWNISSVTQKVIDLVYLPVLIVRAYNQPDTENASVRYYRILIPMDSSRRAECVFAAGIALAQGETLMEHAGEDFLSGTELPLLKPVVPPTETINKEPILILAAVISPPEIPIPAPYPVEISRLSDKLLHISREIVSTYLSEVKLRLPVESETRVIESNNISSAIQNLANNENIDLILMCAHGYTGETTRPFGNVTRNIIDHGTTAILIIQDVPLSQVRPTAAAIAAQKSGRR
jgi:nucleotide-binding universal stress UspA family protein